MIRIVCWKWDDGIHPKKNIRFTAQHVNNLRSAVEKNLKQSHEFLCLTDDWKGFHSSVRVVDINRYFPQIPGYGGCYRRLRAFSFFTAYAIFGASKFISMDLDTVVTGNLDKLFDFQGDFRIWEDRYRRKTPYCGSLWGMQPGARQKVWDQFEEDPYATIGRARELKFVGTDQAVISSCLWPNERVWTREDGIYNFNTQIRRARGCVSNVSIPKGCKLVFFNGKFDPSHVELQRSYPWIGDLWNA